MIFRGALILAKKEQFDVVQVTDVEFSMLSLALALFGRGIPPVVLLVHAANFSFFKYPGNIFFRCYKVFQREFLRTRLGREIKAVVTEAGYAAIREDRIKITHDDMLHGIERVNAEVEMGSDDYLRMFG